MTGGWVFWALLSAGFAALTAILGKAGVAGINADLATFLRTVIAAGVMAPFVLLTGAWSNPFALPTRPLAFLALSACATGASWLCYYRALQLGEASRVAPVDKLSIVLVAFLAYVVFGERPAARDWIGIGLIVIGAIMLAAKR